MVAKTKPEMVLVGEVLTQIAATNLAVQTQSSLTNNLAVKALAQHLLDCLRTLGSRYR